MLELPAWKARRAINKLQVQTFPDAFGAPEVPHCALPI